MIGLEPSVDEWVAEMVAVFAEVRRVLRDDGTLWLNLGDKYAGSGGTGGDYNPGGLKAGQTGGPAASPVIRAKNRGADPRYKQATNKASGTISQPCPVGLKPKDLMGLPWRVAFALQADGWWLRSDIIWSKPNPMPSSVTDRPSTAHEYVFLLTKSARYFYDADAVREAASTPFHSVGGYREGNISNEYRPLEYRNEARDRSGRNRRSVWTIPTAPFPGDHYATYPPALVEPCIKAGTSERGVCPECGAPWARVVERIGSYEDQPGRVIRASGVTMRNDTHVHGGRIGDGRPIGKTGWRATCDHDAEPIPATVLDPFSGAGTTGLVAQRLGRDYIGLELNPEYVEMSQKRIADDRLTKADERIEAGQASMFDMAELREKASGLVGGVSSWQEGPGAHTSIVGRHSH